MNVGLLFIFISAIVILASLSVAQANIFAINLINVPAPIVRKPIKAARG